MKVILTAFGGRLRSGSMEWPEGTPPYVRLPLDTKVIPLAENFDVPNFPRVRIGSFEYRGEAEIQPDGRPALVYMLVDI